MSDATYSDYDISIPPGRTTGQITVLCPKCAHNRKGAHQKLKTLSVQLDDGIWKCHHCGQTGSLRSGWSSDPKSLPLAPKAKTPQQFYPEPAWNFGLKDALISNPDIKLNVPGDFEITWYMRNIHGKLTAAKRMKYRWDGQNFKRDRNDTPLFLNRRDAGYYSCLYLEHDLTTYPTSTVFLVESEKTAAMLRYKFKDYLESYIFLASGGSKNLTEDKYHVLKNRKVLITYDCDPPGREGATDAYNKIKSICTAKVVDLDPSLADGTDLADILEDVDIDRLHSLENQIPAKLQTIWEEIIVKTRPPARVPIISIQNIPICTRGNHSLIIGKKKSRKSLFIVHLISEAIKQGLPPSQILAFDTEQEREDVFEMHDRIWRITNQYVTFFTLRGKSYTERCEIIESTIKSWATPPSLVIIDGIRDLMSNINDADESTALVNLVERITTSHNLHLINVLHLNKTDGNARGHIGTELLNKSEINIELNYDPKSTHTEVSCESSRRHAFNTFMFTHSPIGLPEIVGEKLGESVIQEDSSRNNLHLIFDNQTLHYTELKDELKAYFKVGENKAKQLLSDFLKKGWIVKSGPSRSKDTIYKLMLSLNGNGQHKTEEKVIPNDDPELPF